MKAPSFDNLVRNESEYWWSWVRYNLAAGLLARFAGLPSAGGLVVDWGCGSGGFLTYLTQHCGYTMEGMLGVEPSEYVHDLLRAREISFLNPSKDDVWQYLEQRKPRAITMLDVLEHIEDSGGLLMRLARTADEGCTLVVSVPAFQCLWSVWDEQLGHVRRYTRKQLLDDLNRAGWSVTYSKYIFSGIFPLVFLRKYLIRRRVLSDTQFPKTPFLLNELMKAYFRVETHMLRFPFGTSIVAVAKNHRSEGVHNV